MVVFDCTSCQGLQKLKFMHQLYSQARSKGPQIAWQPRLLILLCHQSMEIPTVDKLNATANHMELALCSCCVGLYKAR